MFSLLKRLFCRYKLRKATQETPKFTLNGQKIYVKVVYIYDGDTMDVCFIHHGKVVKYRCRFLGINAAELKPRLNIPNRDSEIIKAKTALEYVKQWINSNGNFVYIQCHDFDNFGRILVDVLDTKGNCLNKILLDNGLVEKYI